MCPTHIIGLLLFVQMISEKIACPEISLKMFIVLWHEGNFNTVVVNSTVHHHRYQSRKRRPFSRYTARADKVRREKSFAAGSGVSGNFEEQLSDIRGNLVNIQAENNLAKRNMEVMKEYLETLIGRDEDKAVRQKSGRSNYSRAPDTSFKSHSGETEKSTVKKLVQQLRQTDSHADNESVKDLVYNLTNLALAITEDRHNINLESPVIKKKLTLSNSEGHFDSLDSGERKYERKFHSFDKKLKRTNLMKRRESQALLEGIRKSRQSSSNIMLENTLPSLALDNNQ